MPETSPESTEAPRLTAHTRPPSPADSSLVQLRRACGLFTLLLFAVTWRLWLTPHVYPTVPLVSWAAGWPAAMPLVGWAMMLCAATYWAMRPSGGSQRIVAAVFVAGATLCVLANQHCLQAWLYHQILLAVLLTSLAPATALVWARRLLVSIYLFSAFSKFDYEFAHTQGQQFIAVLCQFMSLDVQQIPWQTRVWVALWFPLVELLVALGLWLPRTRRVAAWLAVLLHGTLLLLLGPLGLGHHWGVLAWNAFFIVQVLVLFQPWSAGIGDGNAPAETQPAGRGDVRFVPTGWLLWCVLWAPALETVGWLDHWPAWQLYAPRNSRVELEVLDLDGRELPGDDYWRRSASGSAWQRFDLDAMSLEELGVPVYPQDRFQLGVAIALAEAAKLDQGVKITVYGPANRRTGKRQAEVARGLEEARQLATEYQLNALPNAFWDWLSKAADRPSG